ncbi:IclR family transcriptional regulator [Jatrophihabitans sp. DSM 45814]
MATARNPRATASNREPAAAALDASPPDGTHQNIARASMILDVLARAGNDGLRLTDVTQLTGLSKTAAHRCLAGLVAHGMASLDGDSNLFYLGDRILAWVGMAEERYAIADRVKPFLRRLADESGDTIYFSVRRGDESVCYGRSEGNFPIKTLTLSVGDRRPLGVGSGSLAILAFLEDAEAQRIVKHRRADRANFPISDELLQTMIDRARDDGYALMDGYLIQGMSAVGVPVRDSKQRVKAALSVAAISERIREPRRNELVDQLNAGSIALTTELPELLSSL